MSQTRFAREILALRILALKILALKILVLKILVLKTLAPKTLVMFRLFALVHYWFDSAARTSEKLAECRCLELRSRSRPALWPAETPAPVVPELR